MSVMDFMPAASGQSAALEASNIHMRKQIQRWQKLAMFWRFQMHSTLAMHNAPGQCKA